MICSFSNRYSMKTPQRLISQVNQFLKSKHNIEISLPRLHSLIDSKVNLKISAIPITAPNFNPTFDKNNPQNRYRTIILYIQSLLSISSLDLNTIETFMGTFTKVINTDIDIIQKNQTIRNNSFKIKEKLQFRIQEISKRTHALSTAIQKIHDKSDIISFIAIDIKNYLFSMKLISDQYELVKSVQVHTPLKIDHIYEFEYSSQQDYQDHYEPLLQVLVRLRANMLNLYQSVKNCDRIDLPLKSVNLLANCKNLLMELEQYLITDHCAYNRLIFHVVTQQSQNMKLISNFYKSYLEFVKSLVYNVYKCVYLGHIFKKYYMQYQQQINQQRTKILDLILKLNITLKPETYPQIQKSLKSLQQNLQTIRLKIKSAQNILCYNKTTIMQFYLQEKICKKLSLLLNSKNRVIQLQVLLKNAREYIRDIRRIQAERVELGKRREEIGREVDGLGDKGRDKPRYYDNMEDEEADRRQKNFNNSFLLIQQKNIKISQLQQSLKTHQKQCKQQKLTEQFFPKLLELTRQLKQQYCGLQIKLLNAYQHMLSNQEEKEAEAMRTAKQAIYQITEYLLSERKDKGATYSAIGGDILNQDQHCEVVKGYLGMIDRAEFLLKSIRKKKKPQIKSSKQRQKSAKLTKQLQKLRKYLQYLLSLYEASMDDHILQSIVDKMDFNEESDAAIQKNVGKVKELMGELEKHNKDLRKKSKEVKNWKPNQDQDDYDQAQGDMHTKVVRIIRDRQILYEILQIIYGQFLSVYSDLKAPKLSKNQQKYDIQSKGVLLFNKKVYNHSLLCYHCLNKISIVQKQLNDCNLATETKNYLDDDILQPYINRLRSYVKFSQEEMLDLTLRLEKSLEIEKEYKGRMRAWEDGIEKEKYEGGEVQYKKKLREKCRQFLEMEKQMQQIEQLNKKKFLITNLQDLKKMQKQCEQHFYLAAQIFTSDDFEKLCEGKQFKNEKLNQIVKKIQKNLSGKS